MFLPVLERLFVAVDVELGDSRVQAFLRVGDREVVDRGRDLLDEEVQQRASLDVADRLVHVFCEIALQRRDCAVAYFLVQFDGHRVPLKGGDAEAGASYGALRAAGAGGSLSAMVWHNVTPRPLRRAGMAILPRPAVFGHRPSGRCRGGRAVR
ncbi:hypothetical protein EMIT0111MI5_160027 [Burkholderia sp. IT-111MI5]